jgi:hydroxymethylbilane synthase
MRGNLQTRIKKMKSGVCDALILAYAGVKRMGYDHMIVAELPVTEFVPPVGQGSIAIEVYDSIDGNLKKKIRECINHLPTEAALIAERAYLRKLEGGCSIPVFALAINNGETIELTAGLISLDGRVVLRKTFTGAKKNAAELGNKAGIQILETGGREILSKIKLSQK